LRERENERETERERERSLLFTSFSLEKSDVFLKRTYLGFRSNVYETVFVGDGFIQRVIKLQQQKCMRTYY